MSAGLAWVFVPRPFDARQWTRWAGRPPADEASSSLIPDGRTAHEDSGDRPANRPAGDIVGVHPGSHQQGEERRCSQVEYRARGLNDAYGASDVGREDHGTQARPDRQGQLRNQGRAEGGSKLSPSSPKPEPVLEA